MLKAAPFFPFVFVVAFAGLLLGVERISLWEDAAQPLRIVASND